MHYIGLDNWKVGRTSAWAFANICKAPGKIGILMGNPRYRNQEMNETGFRSYFRELAPDFTLLEPISTFEAAAVAQEMTERLLADHPDLVGLYVSGGGISGALAALRSAGRAGQIVVVGYDLMEVTRSRPPGWLDDPGDLAPASPSGARSDRRHGARLSLPRAATRPASCRSRSTRARTSDHRMSAIEKL